MMSFLTVFKPAYIVLNRQILFTRILNDCYENIKEKVKKILRRSKLWNIFVDESVNIIKNRIINFCVLTVRGTSASNISLWRLELNSTKIVRWINDLLDEIEHFIGINTHEINRFVTDICATMRAT